MGDLSDDLARCLCDCACDERVAERAVCSCEEGRMRATKRVLLRERERLLAEMHDAQRGIDSIDHMLYRVGRACDARSAVTDPVTLKVAGQAAAAGDDCAPEGEVSDRG